MRPILYQLDGEMLSASEIARRLGLPQRSVSRRLKRGDAPDFDRSRGVRRAPQAPIVKTKIIRAPRNWYD